MAFNFLRKLTHTVIGPLVYFMSIQATTGYAETVRVAVASNFYLPLKEIAGQFEAQTGHTVKLSFGSSGKLYSQIQHGAPFDVFFSADRATIDKLVGQQRALTDSRFTYAIGKLVLVKYGRNTSPPPRESLIHGEYPRLALANPKLAPYGLAAVDVLTSLNLIKPSKKKWAMGQNVGQTMQLVRTGNATLGFVALSQVKPLMNVDASTLKKCVTAQSNDEKTDKSNQPCLFRLSGIDAQAWVIPTNLYRPVLQDAVLLHSATSNKAAKHFLHFFRSTEIRKAIERHGYTVENGH